MISANACWRWSVLTVAVAALCTHGAPATKLEQSEKERTKQQTPILKDNTGPPSSIQREVLHRDSTQDDANMAENFLSTYGYFRKGRPLSWLMGSVTGPSLERQKRSERSDAMRMFQSYFGLRQTGRLDKATMDLMRKGRCGVADIPEEMLSAPEPPADPNSPQAYSTFTSKWEHRSLTWKLSVPTSQMDHSEQRGIMHNAFKVWTENTPYFEFQEVNARDKADIDIRFAARKHGDSKEFDGPGLVLAHAYGPGESETAGDVHFDNDETWTTGAGSNSDLLVVASHELGHSLGLGHSRDPEALMYPYYSASAGTRLGVDDIQGLQYLYAPTGGTGQRSGSSPTKATPTVAPMWVKSFKTLPPSADSPRQHPVTTTLQGDSAIDFDFVIKDQQDVYIAIKGDQAFRFTEKGLLPGNPVPLQTLFPGAPARALSVFSVPATKTTYFVADSHLWRYTDYALDNGYPRSLDLSQFQEVIRFILPLVDSGEQQRFIVFGTTYWVEYGFDDTTPRQLNRPYLIPRYWPGVPADVKYGTVWNDGNIYLITPNSHVVLDRFQRLSRAGRQPGWPHWLENIGLQARSHYHSAANGQAVPRKLFLALLVFLNFVFPRI